MTELDPIATWQIDVLDDFTGAVITFKAIAPGRAPGQSDMYELPSTGWTLDVLRRFHAETAGLIAYMESGGKRLPSTQQ